MFFYLWEEFCQDYQDFFFDGSQTTVGRCYMIMVDGVPIGHINYHTVYSHYQHTELDVWMKDEKTAAKDMVPTH